jgi:hypothetical protein
VIAEGSATLFWWGVSAPSGVAVLVAQEAVRTEQQRSLKELTNIFFHQVMPIEKSIHPYLIVCKFGE